MCKYYRHQNKPVQMQIIALMAWQRWTKDTSEESSKEGKRGRGTTKSKVLIAVSKVVENSSFLFCPNSLFDNMGDTGLELGRADQRNFTNFQYCLNPQHFIKSYKFILFKTLLLFPHKPFYICRFI